MKQFKAFQKFQQFQKFISTLIILTFTLSLIPAPAFASGLKKADQIVGSLGDNIYYGSYWQNYNGTGDCSSLANYTKSAVQYVVLDNNSGTGQILVLSDQALYADAFYADSTLVPGYNKWATSEIRDTMNNSSATVIDDSGSVTSWGGYAGDAFTAKELSYIAETTHTAGGNGDNSSCQSTEKLFLLSYGEAQAYGFDAGIAESSARKATITQLAKKVKMYGNNDVAAPTLDDYAAWWLRSPDDDTTVANVKTVVQGTLGTQLARAEVNCARVAFNLNSDSILFASSANSSEGGYKGDVTVGSGFSLTDHTSNNYKLTLYDETIATPSDLGVTQTHTGHATVAEYAKATAAGGTLDLTNGLTSTYGTSVNVSFNSSAITDGNADYVSAVVKDKDGNLVNYAKVSNQATGKDVAVSTGSLENGSYEMYLFAEQENGEYETDYASALSKGYTIHKGDVTTNEGTLTADYKNSGYTANLGNGFNLSFEGAQYNTAVTTASTGASLFGAGSTIGSLDVGGNTNVSGSLNVTNLTRTAGTVTVNGTLTSDQMNATGSNNKLSATYTTVYGANNTVSGEKSAAFGNYNTISGANSIAVGTGHNISGSNSGAFGDPNTVSGSGSYAIGNNNYIGGDNNFVMGNNINTSTYTNSVVLGNGSTVNQSGVVSVGSEATKRKIINVADGSIESGSHEVVTGGQLNTTNANVAANAANITALQSNFELDGTTAKAATKAAQDGDGNVISTTYAKINDVYTKTAADGTFATKTELNAKADASNVYTKADADDTFATKSALDGKANVAATAVKINSGDNINAGSGIVLKQGSNIEITTNGGNEITITSKGGADTDAVHYQKEGATKTNNIVLEGQNAGDKVTIKNVAAGTEDTDAANYGQIKGTYTDATYADSKLTLTKVDGTTTELKIDTGTTSGGDKPEGAKDAEAKGEGAVAMGYDSQAIANGATAVGYGNRATGEMSTAVGYRNVVTGSKSGAFGDPNTVSGTGSYAIGNDNEITGDNTFVLGNNVKTSAKNAVVLGNNSTATRDNTVSVGAPGAERQITNVAAGTMGTDAANMNQLWGVEKEARQVGAMSAALAGLHYVEPSGEGDDKFTGAVAYGGYRGENAAALGLAYKPSQNFMVSASTSVGNSQNMYNAGVSYKFGKGNTAATRAGLQKQVKYLNDRNKQQDEIISAQNAKIEQQNVVISELLERLSKLEKKVK